VIDGRGLTALHYAVRRRLPESTLRTLIKYRADVGTVSPDGVSVSQLATRAHKQLLDILKVSCIAITEARLTSACSRRRLAQQ
jgi:hypothetical protein